MLELFGIENLLFATSTGSSNRFRPRLRARAQSTSEDGGAGDTQRLPLQLELVGFGQGDALEAALAQTREQGGEHLAGEEQPGWLRSRRSGGGGEARGPSGIPAPFLIELRGKG